MYDLRRTGCGLCLPCRASRRRQPCRPTSSHGGKPRSSSSTSSDGLAVCCFPHSRRIVLVKDWLGMRRMKIPLGEVMNFPFLLEIAALARPFHSLDRHVGAGESARGGGRTRRSWSAAGAPAGHLTPLHCTSNYPAAPEGVTRAQCLALREAFGVPVGYPTILSAAESPQPRAHVLLQCSEARRHCYNRHSRLPGGCR